MERTETKKVLIRFSKEETEGLKAMADCIERLVSKIDVNDEDTLQFLGNDYEEDCILSGSFFNDTVFTFQDLLETYMIHE